MKQIQRLFDKNKNIPLSDSDIRELMGKEVNITTYGNLKNYNDVNELLYPNNVCFILYEWRPHYGHWVLLSKSDKDVEFFDPYGGFIDSQLDEVTVELRKELNEDNPYLSNLLRNSPYDISYNEFPFQKLSKAISTCGRWCIIRAKLKDMNLYEFQKLFMDKLGGGDDIVTYLTS